MNKRSIRIFSALLAFLFCSAGILTACSSGSSGSASDSVSDSATSSDSSGSSDSSDNEQPDDSYPDTLFSSIFSNPSKVGMSAEYLGTAERNLPEVSDGGLEKYPVYGTRLSATQEEKQAILDEDASLRASKTTYDSMDAEGNLWLNGEPTGKKLYKHTASVGMYEGDVKNDEPAIIKRLTIRPRNSGNHITGLYAPAGEVVKIELSKEDLEKTGGLTVYIGQALTNGQANNIWLERDFNRMPVILNTMTVKSETNYVGSYLGGPIYIQPLKTGSEFTVTISGAVAYSHFIAGYTTPEEFERNKNSSAPYFDLEVWDDAVRHSGPNARAKQFDYEELTQAALLWEKISLVSNKVPAGSGGDIGITFLYDPFVAAGSMVAFVGRHTVNCPLYCLTAALDAESAVNNASDAFWGCIHEYNHHYQRFGFYPGDEVTNNAVSLVEYSLFTRISANRTATGGNEGSYATGWNRYTNPSWSLKQTLAASSANSALDTYANLLHAFGQDLFIKATQAGNGGGGVDTWYKAVSDATHNDMTYYFRDILHQNVSSDILTSYAEKDYPMFVPVASVYQTGRSFLKDGKKYYSDTARPYEIDTGADFEIDLNTNIVLPQGFTYTVKNVSSPAFGTLTKKRDGVYVYTPDEANKTSGKIFVSLGIIKDDGAFTVDDVELVLEFSQKQYKPNTLERTVYTYSAENMYSGVKEAVENEYAGYTTVTEEDNTNRVQNGNAEIWEPSPGSQAIMEIRGKFRISSDGKYRIALRGRTYAGLYVSLDGKSYEMAADVVNTQGLPAFDLTDENHYTDYELKKGQWVYFKAVLLVTNSSSFIGVGLGKFDGDTVNVSYLNAYRNSYLPETFTSDYFYQREYAYTYSETPDAKQSLVETNYSPWDANYPIDALFDDDDTNFIHSDRTEITAENPFELTVDLGERIRANRFTIYGEPSRLYLPTDFELYGGEDPEHLSLIAKVTDATVSDSNVVINFEEQNLRCYKLIVTNTSASSTKYIAYRRAGFAYELAGGNWISPDDGRFVYRGNWALSSELSTFGHLYTGENATMEFEFSGTRFAIFSRKSPDYESFEVLIDGEPVGTANLRADKGATAVVWLSEALKDGTHTVIIRSKTKFNIDSVVLWQ